MAELRSPKRLWTTRFHKFQSILFPFSISTSARDAVICDQSQHRLFLRLSPNAVPRHFLSFLLVWAPLAVFSCPMADFFLPCHTQQSLIICSYVHDHSKLWYPRVTQTDFRFSSLIVAHRQAGRLNTLQTCFMRSFKLDGARVREDYKPWLHIVCPQVPNDDKFFVRARFPFYMTMHCMQDKQAMWSTMAINNVLCLMRHFRYCAGIIHGSLHGELINVFRYPAFSMRAHRRDSQPLDEAHRYTTFSQMQRTLYRATLLTSHIATTYMHCTTSLT